jgi:hypothetical protein
MQWYIVGCIKERGADSASKAAAPDELADAVEREA